MATKTKAHRASFIYGLIFGLYTVFVGALLVWQVWAIYHSAESKPFSVASISTHFGQIQWFIWGWFAALIANVVLGVIFPESEDKKRYVDYTAQLKKMRARLSDEGKTALSRNVYSVIRNLLWGVCGGVLVAGIILCAYYFSGAYVPQSNSAFLTESNGVAERLLRISLIVAIVAVILAVVVMLNEKVFAKKELSLVKKAVAAEAKAKQNLGNSVRKTNKEDAATQKKKELTVWIARGVLACAAVALIIVGICNGGMMDVLQKAINICTQCIGLG